MARQNQLFFNFDLYIVNHFPDNEELKQNMLNICETGNILHLDYALI